ncbi:glucose-6-phosphate dehydrogenase [Legionella oakridgensis]|uniref:Glucose-6-phosphate 1-dehydrogenase n=2 Tax=Legionella oakridgensis TaxID=29423 RepID=W0B9V9_9GAMM|nr:glucose-6-phosphate dehydrogenase [Legionella oakridgensis]AHE67303.1 glucose-6-phosphate 1-dehydrogenase [Legionella oakridgensis ATCC 33761 = DSM 21215]ETO93055.1 glucose-6-phosphate 1-dehydrogenase [Legionella oakridgensis RV-2-2007]KTD37909.1 glucose-6-phosphate 1-dehydrogenase [Legionella oakridgensis]STY20369.1 glucose-6-phosphate 1-dehydrogenase [Legionella longbeachae]
MFASALNDKHCDLILFGAKGDLACRKLLPALYQLEKAGLLSNVERIIGVARDDLDHAGYCKFIELHLHKFLKETMDVEVWQRLQKKLHYLQMDLTKACDYDKLKKVAQPSTNIIVSYFATLPSLFGLISQGLAEIGFTQEPARVVLEKPIGQDLASSRVINDEVARYFKESQIYRIDHYLGKETVLNLLALRFANTIFASNWDRTMIDHVQISVAEEVGVEGRWEYYDDAGQMRDMVQNHLLQILSLIAMEPPANLDADSIRDEKLKVLKALRPIDAGNVSEKTVRGQYAQGFVGGQAVVGYLEEPGARPNSQTETFVAIKVDIDNWRWAGVPFYLRTGKRMPKKLSEVVICFRPQLHNIFYQTYKHLSPNKLIIRLQPDEGVEVEIMNKIPGLGETMCLQQTKLDLSFDKTFKSQRIADAYERLLLEALLGNQYLFVRRDEVEQAWKWVDGIIHAWKDYHELPRTYQAGSWGPIAAISLLARDGRNWDE